MDHARLRNRRIFSNLVRTHSGQRLSKLVLEEHRLVLRKHTTKNCLRQSGICLTAINQPGFSPWALTIHDDDEHTYTYMYTHTHTRTHARVKTSTKDSRRIERENPTRVFLGR